MFRVSKTEYFAERKKMMAKPLSWTILICQHEIFVDGLSAIAMRDFGKCRCLLTAQYRFAVLQRALRSLAASDRGGLGCRFGKLESPGLSKISMRGGGSAMVGNYDCDSLDS